MCLSQVLYPLCILQERVATFQDFLENSRNSLATSLDECSDNSRIFLSPCSRDPFRGVHQGTRIPTFASPTQKSWKDFSSQSVSLYNASISARLQFQCSTSSLRGEEFCHFFISVVSITEAFKKQKEWVWQPD